MTKTRTLLTIPIVGLLVLAGVFSNVLAECELPPGVTPPPDPRVTAQQVEDGSGSLKDFALAARERFGIETQTIATLEQVLYSACLLRQEGSPWRSGSTYLVSLLPDGRVLVHAKSMALSGRLLNPLIYAEILSALGVEPTDLINLSSPDPAIAAQAGAAVFNTLSQEPDAAFDATSPIPGLRPGIPGASGYAAVYLSVNFGSPIVLLAGFNLNETHVVEEEIDYGDPATTAKDVVDRETLKAFVTEAGEYFLAFQEAGDFAGSWKARTAMRDPNGPWRHDSVYLYILDLTSNIILFHGAFPNRYELRPLVATIRDVVTGELILPQVIEAAKNNPEGGFVEYYFDDPSDDTDSADIPKVGYAREFTSEIRVGGRVLPFNYIVGSGFYGRAPDVVSTGPRTEVEATVSGDAIEGLTVEFARSIAGQQPDYAYNAVTDANGSLSLTISSADGVSGYYTARARNADGETVGQWHSIPLNQNQRQVLELTLSGGMKVVSVAPLTASKPVVVSEPLAVSETVPEVSGLAPNFPNPFNSATLITYHLSSPGPVQLVIYNVLGQPVRTLVDQSQAAGSYQIRWDVLDQRGVSLSTGIYIARLSYPGGVQTQRLLYLK
ncbi:MAG: T9SS type A sorting domain-containing protein [Gemmatimonadetes bacterium]|nr:T9SS type A sorting domain-containing protein [Gemmatimonadota bacterium]